MAILLCVSLFAVLATLITAVGFYSYVRSGRLLEQLSRDPEKVILAPPLEGQKSSWFSALLGSVGSLLPLGPADFRLARKELTAAGIRSDHAVKVLQGLRLVLAPVFVLAALSVRSSIASPVLGIVLIVAAGYIGFSLPGFVLGSLISKRQTQIRLALPDALDLLVVCSEAGIGLDQGIQTVSRELKSVHPALSDEFTLMNFEMLAGMTRSEALRQLAVRTGEPELRKLVAILVQTDRFGTSISEALRTQSDALRIRRRQDAEERAGKLGVKLVFPIFFFCLPSLVILVAGPGILQLITGLFPAMRDIH